MTKKEAKAMVREADTDKNGMLEFDEFVEIVETMCQHERNLRKEILEVITSVIV
jgi:Ca2+-binding EF-hand superfamily protein